MRPRFLSPSRVVSSMQRLQDALSSAETSSKVRDVCPGSSPQQGYVHALHGSVKGPRDWSDATVGLVLPVWTLQEAAKALEKEKAARKAAADEHSTAIQVRPRRRMHPGSRTISHVWRLAWGCYPVVLTLKVPRRPLPSEKGAPGKRNAARSCSIVQARDDERCAFNNKIHSLEQDVASLTQRLEAASGQVCYEGGCDRC
jgi:hypothetical protein